MNNNWKKVKLSEISEIIMGQSPPSKFYNEQGKGIPFFQGVTEFQEFSPKVKKYTTKITKMAIKEDILMSVRAPVGELNILKYDSCIGRGLCAIRSYEKTKYLYYLLKHYKPYIRSKSGGTTYESINKEQIEKLSLLIPIQKSIRDKIAAVLSAYDELIEINNRRIEILEEMAEKIYKEWFVHFRYPGYEKDNMVDSELGKIPEGWKIKQFRKIIELKYGKSLPKNKRNIGNIPVYGSSGLVGYHNNSIVNGPGIVVGRAGNAGEVHWVHKNFFPVDSTFYVEILNKNINLFYLYYYLQRMKINKLASSSAVPGINRNAIYNREILIPRTDLINKFGMNIRQIFYLKKILEETNENLTETRDMLLPKLISGKIDVSGLEIKVEEKK